MDFTPGLAPDSPVNGRKTGVTRRFQLHMGDFQPVRQRNCLGVDFPATSDDNGLRTHCLCPFPGKIQRARNAGSHTHTFRPEPAITGDNNGLTPRQWLAN